MRAPPQDPALRSGGFAAGLLNPRRLRIAVAALLALELAGFAFIVAGTHGWIVPLSESTTTDFVSFYGAGALTNAGTPWLAYDHAAHLAAEEVVVGAGIGYQYFNYPPVFLLLCGLLARLPYLVAFIGFEAATLGLFLFVAIRILGQLNGTAVMALLAFPIVFWNFGLGQNAFLTAGLFGAGTLLIDRRPAVAGLLFGALCYKPQLALLLPLALAAGGCWRAFAAAALSAVGLTLTSLALFGAETWQAFLTTAGASPAMYQSGRILFAGMANAFGGARLLGAGPSIAYALQAIVTLVAAGLVVVAWRRPLSLPTRAAVLAAASLAAAPLVLLYDLMLGAVAAVWLLRDRAAAAAWEKPLLAALYLSTLLGVEAAKTWHLPIYPAVSLTLFGLAALRARREVAGRRETSEFPALADCRR